MTLVVTHTEGFLGCFTVEPDGSMKQRALIDTGSQTHSPKELADLGLSMAAEYDWVLTPIAQPGSQVQKEIAQPVKAIKAPEKKHPQKKKPYVHRSYPTATEKVALILECLTFHPGVTLREALALMGQPDDTSSASNWHHSFRALLDQGAITRAGAGNSAQPHTYSLP